MQHILLRAFKAFSLFLFLMLSPTTLFAETDSRIDSLLDIAENGKTAGNAVTALHALSYIYLHQPEESYYMQKLLEKALEADSIQMAYSTLTRLVNHYHDLADMDSLTYWTHFVDSMVKVRNENPEAYYDAHSGMADLLLYKGLYELSTNEALSLYKKAQQTQHLYGMICGSETLGLIYQASRRDSDAVVAYQEALDKLEQIKDNKKYRVRIISCQIISCLRMNRLDEVKDLLNKYEVALDLWDEYNEQQQLVYPVNYYRWRMHSSYVELYLLEGDLTKARQSLDLSSQYYKEGMTVGEEYAVYLYVHAKAGYYKAIKDYNQALESIELLLADEVEPEDLKMKIDIFLEQGRYKEATLLYNEALNLTEKKKDESFTQQINQLRALYDVNDKEIQAKELQISNMKFAQKQLQLTALSLLSVVLLALLFILYKYLKRTRKLKDELESEKSSLIESKEKLKQAKMKAEVANQMKSAFIANISHEIRTPLNAIVGFSTLLAEPAFEQEEKDEFVNVINLNSDLLLNLINDVLDISRMESGNMKFSFQECDLVECCRKALNSVEHRVFSGVRLTLTTSCQSFKQQTDPLRLQQLLLNLLSNAGKFTKEGEINLSFEADDDRRQLKFSVTDTGAGIPLEKQKRIFERFEKLDEHVQGTGLGLSICQIIAERLGGSVYIDSSYTGGARFVFIHPYDIPAMHS